MEISRANLSSFFLLLWHREGQMFIFQAFPIVESLSKELFMWFQGLDVNFRFQLDPAFLQGFKAGEGIVLGMRGWIGTTQGGGNVTFLFYLKDN